MDIGTLRRAHIGVAESSAHFFDIPSGSDQSRAVGVPQAVERRRGLDYFAVADDRVQANSADCSTKHSPADVPVIVSAPLAVHEHQVVLAAARGGQPVLS